MASFWILVVAALVSTTSSLDTIRDKLVANIQQDYHGDDITKITHAEIRDILMQRQPDTGVNAVSYLCTEDYTTYLLGLITGQEWALRMGDAWGTAEGGRYSGNNIFEGRTVQCQTVKTDILSATQLPYRSRQCISLWPYWQYYLTLAGYAVCIPVTCLDDDIFSFFKLYVENAVPLPARYPVTSNYTHNYCEPESAYLADPGTVVAISLLSFFALLTVFGTLYDVITLRRRTIPRRRHDDGNKNNNAVPRESDDGQDLESPTPAGLASAPAGSDLPVADQLLMNGGERRLSHELNIGQNVPAATQQFFNHAFTEGEDHIKSYDLQKNAQEDSIGNGTYKKNTVGPFDDETVSPKYDSPPNPHSTEQAPPTVLDATDDLELYKPNACESLLLSFSAYTNGARLLSFKHPKGSYRCLNGIRFLSMCWVVLGHTWQLGIILTDGPTVENIENWGILANRKSFNIIDNSNLAVDTFFVLSAMLTTLSLLKQFNKDDKKLKCTTFGLYYFHRFWRLTPVYMLLLMSWTVIFPLFRTGPLWDPHIAGIENCKTNWWKHLIYMNNLIDIRPETECFGWSWYMANEFQFYVIAPLFIGLLFWVPVAGYVMVSLAIAGSITSMGYLFHGVYVREDTVWYYDVYMKPWTRSATYLIGIFLGYLIYRTKCKVKMHIAAVIVGWLVALSFVSMAAYGAGASTANGWVAYSSLQRPMFALGICWIIFACMSGYGGIFNSILSWHGWLPIAKLTYTGYLIHPMFLYYTYYSSPIQIYVTDWAMIYYFLGTLLLALGASTVVTLTLEIPFINMEKVMFRNVRK